MLKKSKLVSLLLLLLLPIFCVSGNTDSFGKGIYNNESDRDELNENDFIIRRKVLFDSHPIGAYTDEMLKRDWSAPWRNLYTPNTTTIQQVDGRRSLASFYKKDTGWGRGGGLNQWVPLGGQDNVEEIYMTYRIKFESGFDWRLGGKLPGMAFGINQLPKAGDGTNLGDRGSSVRLMWSRNGQVFLYAYHHAMTSNYGDRLGLGDFGRLQPDVWHTITMRIVANDVGRRNGIIQVWIDDSLVATATNVLLRTASSPKTIGEIGIHTFMGGASSDWAPNRDQHMWLNDFHFWQYSDDYLRRNPNVARGLNAHPQSHNLYTPLNDAQSVNKQYSLVFQVNSTNGGKIESNVPLGNVSVNQDVNLRAIPNEGFTFLNWSRNGTVVSQDPNYSFKMPEMNIDLVANFEKIDIIPDDSQNQNTKLIDGLLVYYEMDKNQNNILVDSHNGHNGINRGNVQLVNGYRDNGFQYNGSTSISEVPHADLLNLNTQFTITVDIYRTGNGQSGTSVLVGKEFTPNRFSQIYSVGLTPENRLRIRTRSNGNERNFVTNQIIPSRTWVRIIVTYQAGRGYEVYINNTNKESSQTLNGSLDNSSGPLFIGANSDGTEVSFQDRRFQGVMDNVAIWNRVLTLSQIKELMEKKLTYVDFGNVNGSSSSLKTNVFPPGSGNIKVQIQN